MSLEDKIRYKKSPDSGENAGNQAIVDDNLKAVSRLVIPVSEENTFNGGKEENGVIKLSRNSDGDLVLNTYADGKWTEYAIIQDGLKEVGEITLSGNDVTVESPVRWRINSINYEKLTDTVITVSSASDGFKRIDFIYADTDNNILLEEGTEVPDGNPYIQPNLPEDTVLVAPVFISGNTIEQPYPPLEDYVTLGTVLSERQTIVRETEFNGDKLYITGNPETTDFDNTFVLIANAGGGQVRRMYTSLFAKASAVAAAIGITINSIDSTLNLSARGYYNHRGTVNSVWTLPTAIGNTGLLYRIYNKAANGTSTLTVNTTGSQNFFRGGALTTTIALNFGENLTLVSDGTDWNVYN